ncbi:hypothetical protein QYM36_016832, partial [Artemia franciscana]
MRQFSHPNLLQCFGSFVRGSELMVVLPLVVYGSVKDLLSARFQYGFSESMCAAVLSDVLSALEYLHSRGYIHRSLKASHLLISGNGKVILTGLGDAFNCIKGGEMRVKAYELPRMAKCSFPWLSPEVLAQNLQGYCKKSDIYSVGILACELANGNPPFSGVAFTELLLMKLTGTFNPRLHDSTTTAEFTYELETTTHDAVPADSGVFESMQPLAGQCQSREQSAAKRTFSDDFHEFVAVCVQRDIIVRPTASQLKKHSFFNVNRKYMNSFKEALSLVQPLVSLTHENVSDASSDGQKRLILGPFEGLGMPLQNLMGNSFDNASVNTGHQK